ncbi:GNAT family protein [Nitrosarchaeum sp.]|uniref:GNAT family N-acetyltransferase n=1 Tax=Nitrosarchaeum sp. TaxID=2026886 RepID=UPI00247BC28F|nr:GNAT family protein [Nitrosarchaeum sp.]MCV0411918.1 GNAT family N-acetyltransferase [Nitrosarchaeum sp.]
MYLTKLMISGNLINLRAIEETDLKELKKLRNTKQARIHTREFRLLSMINQKTWFESIHTQNPPHFIMFVVENKNGKLIGICGLTYIDWKNRHAEISILLSQKNWQKTNPAKEIIYLLEEYGFGELNLHRLWAEIFETAPLNIALFEMLNYKLEGKLREKLWRNNKWNDSFIFSKLMDD